MSKNYLSCSRHGNSVSVNYKNLLSKRYGNKYDIYGEESIWSIVDNREEVVNELFPEMLAQLSDSPDMSLLEFFEKTLDAAKWGYVFYAKDDSDFFYPILVIDYDKPYEGEIRSGKYFSKNKSVESEVRNTYDIKIWFTRILEIPYIIVPKIYDKHMGIDTDQSHVWFLDLIISSIIHEIY